MFPQNISPVPATSHDALSPCPPVKGGRSGSLSLQISGSWSIKATFLTSSGPGIPGTDPHWWIAIFTGSDPISPESTSSPCSPNTLIVRSNQDMYSMGIWNSSSSDAATFSLVMQMFQMGVWMGNLNIYCPLLMLSSDGNILSTPSDKPAQAIQYDSTGKQVGQVTIGLSGTRIPIAKAELLPIQS